MLRAGRQRRMRRPPRLADPRLTGQQRQPPLAARRLRNQLAQPLSLRAPADQTRRRRLLKPRRQRQQAAVLGASLPHHLDCLKRLRQPLQLKRTDRRELLPATRRQMRHQRLGQDLTARATITKPRRLDHRHPEIVIALRRRVARAQPDLDHQLLPRRTIPKREPLLDPGRARNRSRRAVKHQHHPITGVLHLTPASVLERLANQPEMLATKLIGRHRADTRLKTRRADQVGDQHRDSFNRSQSQNPSRFPPHAGRPRGGTKCLIPFRENPVRMSSSLSTYRPYCHKHKKQPPDSNIVRIRTPKRPVPTATCSNSNSC